MSRSGANNTRTPAGKCDCLARSVVNALAAEPTLEAVTIDRTEGKLHLATLGQTDVQRIANLINADCEENLEARSSSHCSLLNGTGDCATCGQPLPGELRQRLNITHAGATTTIARVTCPTAPKFWRWRDIPIPKVVQRDVEFIEDEHHEDEWKPQLLLAAACGALGLLAAYAVPDTWRIPVFALSYLAGA